MIRPLALLALLSGFAFSDVAAQEVNVYSSRHYKTDERLYSDFEAQTGIRVNRLEADGAALLERLKQEGRNSPADLLITVDAGMLWRAEEAGLFASIDSPTLEARIPSHLRHPEGKWFGLSTRARMIFVNRDLADPSRIASYDDLADPAWRGQLCIRSSSNIYNLSLMSAIIAHRGAEAAEAWARGLVANFARPPQGGDIDQLRAAAAGECALAVANSYYFARLMLSGDETDRRVVERLVPVFPDRKGPGVHVNISGAGILANAPHPEAARAFLDYLTSDSAQRYFAQGNNEYPVVPGLLDNPALHELGEFRVDTLNVSLYGAHQAEAQRIMDRAGWR